MAEDAPTLLSIAVLGGTGKEGAGLAMRWALNGYRVIVGSRDSEKAARRAAEMNAELGGDYLTGMENAEAARAAHLVVMSVPYSAHRATLEGVRHHLNGKVLVDVTVPLNPTDVRTVFVPDSKAAALESQAYLGSEVRVVAAFQNVSASELRDPNHHVDCDVLVCADDAAAKAEVMELVKGTGMRPVDAGPLANAVAVEALTPVLLYINRAYKVKGAGIRITGIQ